MKLWVEHVTFVSAALEAFENFRKCLEDLPGNVELNFTAQVDFNISGYPTGWSLVIEDDTVYWEIKEETDE